MLDNLPISINLIIFVAWFFMLIKSADYLIDWSVNIAKKYRISNLVIWMTIIAFWTSAPELFVNLSSAMSWNTDLALWNIIWSNIANILLILWVSALIYPLRVRNSTVFREAPFSLLVSLALFFLIEDKIFAWLDNDILTRWESLVLLLFFVIFCVYTYWIMKNVEEVQEWDFHKMTFGKSILCVIWWTIWLALWAKAIQYSAVNIASSLNISETIIWLTIVAIWTSLPELVASIAACRKRNSDIVLWNIIWSNIMNILVCLSLAWVIAPIKVSNNDIVFIWIELFTTILLMMFLFIWKERRKITKSQWAVFLALYIVYMWYIVYTTLGTIS